ncbi:uncharacterized protein [Aegilops tauschii subsp. strangulata]|uniref:uncharacterized protein n=1 Tax=Aegilops tauschii subsp. strangulata TaxID=200361 RepID=UPI001E1C9DFB|nr:uncharacterized protein LOC123494233 [Aegilops tauschii subsp. strangulata]
MMGAGKNDAVALVRLRESCDLEIEAETLIKCLAKTYPWRWDWKAKKVSDGVFLVNFPSTARINEAAVYDWVPLKGGNITVNVRVWNDDAMAVGKLSVVWIRAKGVPKSMKNYHGLCEVGSTIGYLQAVDMELMSKTGLVRLKVAVVDHTKIPRWTKLTTPDLMVFRIFFEVEEVVENGWAKDEDELSQGYEEWMDFQQEEEESREAKKAKTNEEGVAKNQLCASTRTRIAAEERDTALKEQEAANILMYSKNVNKDKSGNMEEEVGSASVNGEGEKLRGKSC